MELTWSNLYFSVHWFEFIEAQLYNRGPFLSLKGVRSYTWSTLVFFNIWCVFILKLRMRIGSAVPPLAYTKHAASDRLKERRCATEQRRQQEFKTLCSQSATGQRYLRLILNPLRKLQKNVIKKLLTRPWRKYSVYFFILVLLQALKSNASKIAQK
jgi:hypothetical protein